MKIAVLGGGNGSYAAAADLTDQGHEVRFWRRDTNGVQALQENNNALTLKDFKGKRNTVLSVVTSNISEAIAGTALIVCPTPANAQEDIARLLAPHLIDDQVVFLPPGSLGSYLMAKIVFDAGNKANVCFAEAGTLPYLTRKHGKFEIAITTRATRLPTGVFPMREKAHALSVIRQAYASVEDAQDALSGALMNAGPIIHPPLILMNAGPIEHFEHWDIHNEGTQASIRRVTTRLDNERIAVRNSLGYCSPHFPLSDHYDSEGDEWMYGNLAHDRLVDSGDWREQLVLQQHRYMREDVQIGLALLVSIADWIGVPAPTATGLLAIGSAVCDTDFASCGRTLSALGLNDMNPKDLQSCLERASDVPTKPVIASVGAGRMGRGIAITFALAGYEVRLIDVKVRSSLEFDALRKSASSEILLTIRMLSDIGLLNEKDIVNTIARVSYHAMQDCATGLLDASVIFEAVPETLDAKEAALKLISRFANASAIVASTTSTILSDELQPFVTIPNRFLNAHWLNPAFLIPLVEVSPGRETDPDVVKRLNTLLETMGKVPVVCSASPGYIVPRIQALAMNEAARMVEEGVASVEDIDKATKYGFGFRFAVLGVLEFIDWGGGDILYYASRYMKRAMQDDRYASPQIIEDNMREGRTGLSTRKGFLDYSSMDVNKYQTEKLTAFVSMLQHIDKLPPAAKACSPPAIIGKPTTPDARVTVQRYLNAMESRKLDTAQAFLDQEFCMTFPGGKTFTTLSQLVEWSKTRYQTVGKTIERFDQCQSEDDTIVYCYGTLSGVWLDGTRFSDIRFVDRFIVVDGLIRSQLVWNDLAESLAGE